MTGERGGTRIGLRDLGAAVALLILLAVLAVLAPDFFRPSNLRDLAVSNAPAAIVAIGLTLVLLTGQVDISVGSQFAIASVAYAVLVKAGAPAALAVLAALALGAVLGLLNGWLVARLGMPSVVVTLATMVVWRDAVRWYTEGAWVQGLPGGFQWFGLPQTAGEVVIVGLAVVLAGIAAYVLRSVVIGRWLLAVGSDAEAARLSGLRPPVIVMGGFVVLGALTALAAVLNDVRFSQVPPSAGIGLELKVLAAAVVGGTLITGGRGTVLGTMAGIALLGTLGTGLTFVGLSPFWEKAAQGAIILVAAAVDSARARPVRPSVSRA